jgi:pseudouridine-5'-phosphate glycosidase
MRIAAMAGIRVFATGGIGGVHRGADATGDVSADLPELARSPVAVISAGAKAILDLPRTLEMLDTLSVPVIGHATDDFPAFYSRKSGLTVSARADNPSDIAAILAAHWRLPGSGGVLVANPIPAADEIPAAEIDAHIAQALADADAQHVLGKDVTPILLARIRDLTGGRSQRANVALAVNNAHLGGQIAVALTRRDGLR